MTKSSIFRPRNPPDLGDLFRKLTQSCCKINFWKDVEIDLLVLPRGFLVYTQRFFHRGSMALVHRCCRPRRCPPAHSASSAPPSSLLHRGESLTAVGVHGARRGRRHPPTCRSRHPAPIKTSQAAPPPRPAPVCECCASGALRCSVSTLWCCCVGSFGADRSW